jgi:hypothetical protein
MSHQQILIKKANGESEPFDIQKLEHSLERANASRGAIHHVTHHILKELQEGISTHDIYNHAFKLLQTYERRAALKYSLRRAVLDLGPSGFPFERLISELFKKKGFQTLTDQIVSGGCVDHEIDVVAWKSKDVNKNEPGSLIMSEVKYHGQPTLKSDLKIVLYVKARFEDLSKATFMYGREPQMLTEGWLVTNTKFTVSAIKYAECQQLKIIGWNYPLDGSLHDLIDAAALHPLTCLRTLHEQDKKYLLEQGYILCTSFLENHRILESLGLSKERQDEVLEEVRSLVEDTHSEPIHEG